MRRPILLIAATMILAAAAPVQADAGLPKLATLQVGHRTVAIRSDSAMARTGANVFTVEVTDWAEGAEVSLKLLGPDGQVIAIPLQPVEVLGASTDGHAGGHAGAQATGHRGMNMPGMDMPGMDHGAQAHASSEPAQTHDAGGNRTFSARGKVNLPQAGSWRATVAIMEAGKAPETADVVLDAGYAGPHPVYLAGTGTLMGAAILYGAIQKRRGPATGRRRSPR